MIRGPRSLGLAEWVVGDGSDGLSSDQVRLMLRLREVGSSGDLVDGVYSLIVSSSCAFVGVQAEAGAGAGAGVGAGVGVGDGALD